MDVDGRAGEEDAVAMDRLELELIAGAGTSTVTVGELTLTIEYPILVTVVGDGTVTTFVWVRSDCTVLIEVTISVLGDIVTLSVWTMVLGGVV